MKTITKVHLLVMVLFFSVSLVAQNSLINNTGTTPLNKQELIQQMHGPTVNVPSAPEGGKAVGDDCNDPFVINYASDTTIAGKTTVGTGNNYSNTCLNDFDGGNDVIFKLILSEDLTLTINLDPKTTTYTGFALNEQCFDDPTVTCLAVSTDTWGTGEAHDFSIALEAGTYFIMVDSWPNAKTSEIPDFDLSITEGVPVPNDDCSNAIEIGEVTNFYFGTQGATDDGVCTDGANIWYDYTPTFTGNAVISLCGSQYDTQLGVFDGTACPPVANLECNDDWCDFQSQVIVPVVQGNVYKIEIGGWDGDSGFGYLNIYNDDPSCDLVCPTGGTPEGEACGEDDNGGCNMDTVAFTTVMDGDTICGNLWADGDARDTDWFEITTSAVSNIKLAVIGEERIVFGMVAQIEMGVAGCDNLYDHLIGIKVLPGCIEDSIEFAYLPAGTYYFMVAPVEFDDLDCPGFDYQAAFTVQADAYGTISGTVGDGAKAGIENVVVTADVYSTLTDVNGDYSLQVPPGVYDVNFNGMAVGFGSLNIENVTVTDGNITDVDATLSDVAPVLTAGAAYDFSYAKLSWNMPSKETDMMYCDIVCNNATYVPGSTVDLEFTMSFVSPDFEWLEYLEIELPTEFTINSASNVPGIFPGSSFEIAPTISGQLVYWTESGNYIATPPPGEVYYVDFSVNVTIDGGATGSLSAEYFGEGDGYGNLPHTIDGFINFFEDGAPWVPTYNVYRKLDDNTGNVFIPLVDGIVDTELYDLLEYNGSIITGDWCYFVTANMEDGTESAPSNIVCVEVLDPCDDAIDYGAPGDPALIDTLEYDFQFMWFTFTTPGGDIQISTCGSDFDTQFALYSSCDSMPIYPVMVPAGADTTATDGCNDIGQASLTVCALEGGTYYLAVFGENDEIGEIELEITNNSQCMTIYEGWGGFSTYIEPSPNDSIQVVLAEMENEMTIAIRQKPYGIWWAPENINTIGKITPVLGYKAKMTATESTIVTGTEIANKTVSLPKGASYLPVRVPYPTDIAELETQLGAELLLVYNIYNPAELLWPDGGLSTLDQLIPDYAYQINVYNAIDFAYPSSKSVSQISTLGHTSFKGANVAWNDVVNTGNTHFISISADAMGEIMLGDIIGVFNAQGICVGFVELENTSENNLVIAFGDDTYTMGVMDGFEEEEMMNFKLYRPSTGQEYALEVTWNTSMPNNDGLFANDGLSMISNLKVGPTDISESEFANVSIYPNPTSGVLSINGLNGDANVTVTNVHGQLIFNATLVNNQLDMSNQPKGVYFIRIYNNDEMMIQKVILK